MVRTKRRGLGSTHLEHRVAAETARADIYSHASMAAFNAEQGDCEAAWGDLSSMDYARGMFVAHNKSSSDTLVQLEIGLISKARQTFKRHCEIGDAAKLRLVSRRAL